jgi:hypothetical protein
MDRAPLFVYSTGITKFLVYEREKIVFPELKLCPALVAILDFQSTRKQAFCRAPYNGHCL